MKNLKEILGSYNWTLIIKCCSTIALLDFSGHIFILLSVKLRYIITVIIKISNKLTTTSTRYIKKKLATRSIPHTAGQV